MCLSYLMPYLSCATTIFIHPFIHLEFRFWTTNLKGYINSSCLNVTCQGRNNMTKDQCCTRSVLVYIGQLQSSTVNKPWAFFCDMETLTRLNDTTAENKWQELMKESILFLYIMFSLKFIKLEQVYYKQDYFPQSS